MADTIGNNCPHLKEFAGSHLVHDDEQNNEIKYSIHEKLHHVLQLRCHLSREMNAVLNDDDCLRFLVARSFVIKDTIEMIDRWTKWFQTPTLAIFDAKHQRFINCSPKEILDLPDPKEDVYSRLYPHSNLGCDKYGRPIYWEKIGIASGNFRSLLKEVTVDELISRHVRQQQLMMRRISASNRLDKSKRQAFDGKQVVVFDAANLCFWPPWDAFAVLHQWILIDEAYYPERLFRMIIINCPSFFTTLWSIIKNWIDPATLLKIVIVGEDYHNCLTELIDKSEIPAEYGGSRDTFSWTFPSNYDYHVELNNEA